MHQSARSIGLALVLVASAVSLDARAEGAMKLLECDIVRVCDARGICNAGSGGVRFQMEPVELAAGGAGSYRISYGEVQSSMQAMSDIGPFVWTADSERNALIASSDTEWLWHELELGAAPRATVRFLTCTFQQ
jgi:hypothetical protein